MPSSSAGVIKKKKKNVVSYNAVTFSANFTLMQYYFSDVKAYGSCTDVKRLFQEHFKEATDLRIQ